MPSSVVIASTVFGSVPLAQRRQSGENNREMARERSWHRHEIDTDQSWAAFVLYRDMPASERWGALKRIANKLATDYQQMRLWAAEGIWKHRAREFDNYRDAQAVRIKLHDNRPMDVRHAELARGMIEAATLALKQEVEAIKAKRGKFTARDISRMSKIGAELERLVAGKPTSRDATESPDLSNLTEVQLAMLSEIQEAIKGKKKLDTGGGGEENG